MRPRLHVLSTEVTAIACAAVRDFNSFASARDSIEASRLKQMLTDLATLNQDVLKEKIGAGLGHVSFFNDLSWQKPRRAVGDSLRNTS